MWTTRTQLIINY